MIGLLKSFLYRNQDFSEKLTEKCVSSSYNRKKINKIAVMVFTPGQERRLQDIIYYMDNNKIDIIYALDKTWCTRDGEKSLKKFATEHSYGCRNIIDVLCNEETYSISFSTGMWFGHRLANHYLPDLIAESHIKLIYSHGADKTMLSRERVFMFDKILCYGPYQKKKLEQNCNAEIFEVGNTRLDKYFYGCIDRSAILNALNIDISKKNIVWLPTAYHNSIKEFIHIFEKLNDDYNVIVSPHALTLKNDIDIIYNSKIKFIIDPSKAGDLNLFTIADFVFCDYGGAMFTALYFDKNMVLLNSKQVYNDVVSMYGEDTSELYVREKYINGYFNDQYDSLYNDLANEKIWEEQKELRQLLVKEFFVDRKGYSAYYAAQILKKALRDAS